MQKKSYLSFGRRIARWFRAANDGLAETWFSGTVYRDELCRMLARGPRLVMYVGHGNARGLSGYLGLRWPHLAEVPLGAPCGTVICFACDTLKHRRGAVPFGCQWVASGRATAYFGAVEAVSVKGNAKLVCEVGTSFGAGHAKTLAELVVALDRRTASDPSLGEARRAFRSYRIIGNPLQPFF
jgi:hypothetical protein